MASEKELCASVNSDNVFQHFQESIENGFEELHEKCIEYIVENSEAVLNSSSYLNLKIDELKAILEVLVERDDPEMTKISNQLLFKWTDADPKNRSSTLLEFAFLSNKKGCSSGDYNPSMDFESISRYNFDMSKLLEVQMRQFEIRRVDENKQHAFIMDNYNQILSKVLEIVQEQNKQVRTQSEKNAIDVMELQNMLKGFLTDLNEQKRINKEQNEQLEEEHGRSTQSAEDMIKLENALKKANDKLLQQKNDLKEANEKASQQRDLLARDIYRLQTSILAFVLFYIAYWLFTFLRR